RPARHLLGRVPPAQPGPQVVAGARRGPGVSAGGGKIGKRGGFLLAPSARWVDNGRRGVRGPTGGSPAPVGRGGGAGPRAGRGPPLLPWLARTGWLPTRTNLRRPPRPGRGGRRPRGSPPSRGLAARVRVRRPGPSRRPADRRSRRPASCRACCRAGRRRG